MRVNDPEKNSNARILKLSSRTMAMIQNAKPSVVPCMTVPDLRRIVLAGDLRDQSMILAGFMGIIGIREIDYINRHCYG